MSESEDIHTEGARQAPHEKSQSPMTLGVFLKSKAPSPGSYLAAVRKLPPASCIGDSEREELVVLIENDQTALLRLEALLAEIKDEQSLVCRDTTRLAEAFLARQTTALKYCDHIGAGMNASDIRDIVRSLLGRPKDPEHSKKRQVAIRFLLWLARLRGVIDSGTFFDLVELAFPPPSRKAPTSGHSLSPDVGSILAPLLHKRPVRDAVLATANVSKAKLSALTQQLNESGAETEKQRGLNADLRQTIQDLENRVAQLDSALAAKDQQTGQLVRDVADHKAMARQADRRLRARVNGLLQGELLPLVRDIHDSATMEPVRTHVILDRAETLRNLMEKEAKWLESSD